MELVEVATLSTHIATQEQKWNDLKTIRLKSTCIGQAPDPPYELLCMTLEKVFKLKTCHAYVVKQILHDDVRGVYTQ